MKPTTDTYTVDTDEGSIILLDLKGKEPGGTWEHHEEEYSTFNNVLGRITSPNPTMVELGCWWAVWSVLFGKRFPNAKLVINDKDSGKKDIGLKNLELNGLEASPYSGYATVKLLDKIFVNEDITKIDLLHMDIQSAELKLLSYCFNLMKGNRLDNLIVATHSTDIQNSFEKKFNTLANVEILHTKQFTGGKYGDGEIVVSKKL